MQSDTIQSAPVYVWLHEAFSGTAILLGAYLLSFPKGTRPYRVVGSTWVVLMLLTSGTSFLIQQRGGLGPIHILSVVSSAAVISALVGARRRNLTLHRTSMIGAYAGLVGAGAFTVLPYRMPGELLFGP